MTLIPEVHTALRGAVENGSVRRRPRRSRSRGLRFRPALGLGGVAVAAATALAVVLLPLGGRIDVVQAAQSALGEPGEIIHYEVLTRSSRSDMSASPPEKSRCKGPAVAVWQATSGPVRWRMTNPPPLPECRGDEQVTTSDGQIYDGGFEVSIDGTTSTNYIPQLNRLDITTDAPASERPQLPGLPDGIERGEHRDLVSTLRAMLAAGNVRVVGGAQNEHGRKTITLRGSTHVVHGTGGSQTTTDSVTNYVVDAAAFTPLRYEVRQTVHFKKGNGRPSDGSFNTTFSVRFPVYERLPYTSKNAELLTIHPARPPHVTTATAAQRDAVGREQRRRADAEGRRT